MHEFIRLCPTIGTLTHMHGLSTSTSRPSSKHEIADQTIVE